MPTIPLRARDWQNDANLAEAKARLDAVKRDIANRKAVKTAISTLFGG